jgi:hypothetical protein
MRELIRRHDCEQSVSFGAAACPVRSNRAGHIDIAAEKFVATGSRSGMTAR